MLVLSRKIGEKVYIGDNVTLQVVSIQRGQVKLGVVAPSDVKVTREELMNREDKESKGEKQ